MGKEVTVVIYKPNTQSTEEYMVVVNPEEYKKYKDGAFDIFHSSTGHTGQWGRASKQQLEGTFGTSKEDEAVKQVLDKGVAQTGSGFAHKWADTNDSRGGTQQVSRGGPR